LVERCGSGDQGCLTSDCNLCKSYHIPAMFNLIGWLRNTVGRTPVFGRWTDPVLRSACSWRV